MKFTNFLFGFGLALVMAGQILHAQQSDADARTLAELRAKAEQGDAKAQYELGDLLCLGGRHGVSKNEVEAVTWFRRAAEQNLAVAQNDLGLCYDTGQGVAKDQAEAVKWYRKAAEQNFGGAQFNLAICYEHGQGTVQDRAEAVRWYRKAAEQGVVEAQYNLGVCFKSGQGVPQNDAESVKWVRKAADQGHPAAQVIIGCSYEKGLLGFPQDCAEAVKWYRKAADQKDALAQYNLAVCLENGQGVTKDPKSAYGWFLLAAAAGNENAKRVLPQAESLISKAEVIEARNWANAWRVGPATKDNQTVLQNEPSAKAFHGDRSAPNERDQAGNAAALHRAAYAGDLARVNALISAGANVNARHGDGATPLILASQQGCRVVVLALLAAGADPNVRMEPAANGVTALMQAAENGHADVVRALVNGKANVNARNDEGFSPLLKASTSGGLEIVKILLGANADVNAKAANGATGLMLAAAKGHGDIVRALLEANADKNAQTPNGWTALMYARKANHSEIVQMLAPQKESSSKIIETRKITGKVLSVVALDYDRKTGEGGSLSSLGTVSLDGKGIIKGVKGKSGWVTMNTSGVYVDEQSKEKVNLIIKHVSFWVNEGGKHWWDFEVEKVVLANSPSEPLPFEAKLETSWFSGNRPVLVVNKKYKLVLVGDLESYTFQEEK